jgi:hypothetical protein
VEETFTSRSAVVGSSENEQVFSTILVTIEIDPIPSA